MSSIPFAMFSAKDVHDSIRREQERQQGPQGKRRFIGNRREMNETSNQIQFGDMYNYNLKFMNSVWGLYNRYAPQAFQKNEEVSKNCQ